MKISGTRGGELRLRLDETEAVVLRDLVREMRMLLEADIPRTDSVKQRLFPTAYEDPENEETFRDLVATDLEKVKLDAVKEVSAALGPDGAAEVDLGPDDIGTWLRLLTDLRLAIGVRLDVTEETMSDEIEPGTPDASAYAVLHWLGFLQGSILERIEG